MVKLFSYSIFIFPLPCLPAYWHQALPFLQYPFHLCDMASTSPALAQPQSNQDVLWFKSKEYEHTLSVSRSSGVIDQYFLPCGVGWLWPKPIDY